MKWEGPFFPVRSVNLPILLNPAGRLNHVNDADDHSTDAADDSQNRNASEPDRHTNKSKIATSAKKTMPMTLALRLRLTQNLGTGAGFGSGVPH